MVQFMKSSNYSFEKLELELHDSGNEELFGSLRKRPKLNSSPEWNSNHDFVPVPPTSCDSLNEPSPLGLRLRKSPSLLDLIQMRLSKEDNSRIADVNEEDRKVIKATAALDAKLKASNFPASILRIGTWECKSRHEGDLVAKCYYAKHKLVWEVLDGGLKSKIEIPWSDIMALNANYPENGPGTLEVVLARRPLFFKEINPQPRKHTLWQTTSDFTGGQASIHRKHFLQCPQGFLGKHFEKLIQCDHRLNFLSQQPNMVLGCPYFESRIGDDFDRKREDQAGFFGLKDLESASAVHSSSSIYEHNLLGIAVENNSSDTSPSSVKNTHETNGFWNREANASRFLSNLSHVKLPGLQPSISMTELLVRSRVNSFCSLLQSYPSTTQGQLPSNKGFEAHSDEKVIDMNSTLASQSKSSLQSDASVHKQGNGFPRKESVGELLDLPRIASLPQFLLHISEEDSSNQVR
ncbi:uncharacterized protein LOC114747896 isoform X1 [Neltuma alba]|uniref:uncharacterized protein LOC114747896 isoform X1 n=1 Tax=Neltuma alba TaxID=207710 RepID=UPI0010A45AD5|nr:uncharacterized protein LOC114747896 isoform X1 [Prosopis alba]